MSEDGLNKIIRRVYAEDLELIAKPTDLSLRRQHIMQALKEKLWSDHSSAIKVAIVSLSLAIISAAIYYYNFFTVNVYQALQEKANVEAHLQRRSDLVPNLVKSAGGYLNYEKNIFGHIAEIRGAVAGMKTLEQMNIPDRSVLSKFQAVAEAYPALKASEAYTTLMKELSDTETRIAESRIKYNQIANFYNSRLQMFPGIIFNTFLFRFKALPVFEASKTPVPDVYQRPLTELPAQQGH
jgi:LemA protein